MATLAQTHAANIDSLSSRFCNGYCRSVAILSRLTNSSRRAFRTSTRLGPFPFQESKSTLHHRAFTNSSSSRRSRCIVNRLRSPVSACSAGAPEPRLGQEESLPRAEVEHSNLIRDHTYHMGSLSLYFLAPTLRCVPHDFRYRSLFDMNIL